MAKAEQATLICDEFLDLAAAVALDAAQSDESRSVEAHAAICPDCARRLEDFREVAAALGSSVPQLEPPVALRSRVVEAAKRTPQRTLADPDRLFPRLLRRARSSAAWLVAAASLVISLMAIVRVAALQGQIMTLQEDALAARDRATRYEHVVEVLASDKLAIRPLRPVAQGMPYRGTVYMDPSSGTGMLMCHNLPQLQQGRAYQLWFARGNERVSGGLLWPDRNGNGYTLIQVPTDVMSFESIGLTDEPGTGSSWPTTPRVIGSPLNQ
jgi:hypothetical protein